MTVLAVVTKFAVTPSTQAKDGLAPEVAVLHNPLVTSSQVKVAAFEYKLVTPALTEKLLLVALKLPEVATKV